MQNIHSQSEKSKTQKYNNILLKMTAKTSNIKLINDQFLQKFFKETIKRSMYHYEQ